MSVRGTIYNSTNECQYEIVCTYRTFPRNRIVNVGIYEITFAKMHFKNDDRLR